MNAFDMSQVMAERQRSGRAYLEFLRVPSMSAGVYHLPAGGADTQRPHKEDEAYYVMEGRGSFRAGDEDRAIGPGAFIFVEAGKEHRFHSITEDMTLLVFFSPAES